MKYYLLVLAFLFFPAISHGATFYVCPDSQGEYGLENGTSLANCWDGWGVASTTGTWYAHASNTSPGDTIYACGDWTASDTRAIVNDDGINGGWITVDGSPGPCGRSSTSTISRAGLTGTNGRAISATGKNFIRFRNIIIRDCDQYCISWDHQTGLNSDTYLELQNVEFDNCGQGTNPGNCIWKRGAGLHVYDSSFNDCYEDCVWSNGRNFDIRRNRFSDISSGSILGDAVQVGGADLNNTGYTYIIDNYCDHQAVDVKYCFLLGPSLGASSTIEVANNVALCPPERENATTSAQCHPIYLDIASTTAFRVYGNFTQGGEIGITISATTSNEANLRTRGEIYGNVVYKATDRGILTDGNVDNVDIWNNTVSDAIQEGIYIDRSNSSIRVFNNIMVNNDTGLRWNGTIPERGYNVYYNNGTTTAVNGIASSTTSTDLTVNPQFVAGENPDTLLEYRLMPTSPLLYRGTRIKKSTDAEGKVFSTPPTYGALEHGSRDFAI